MKFFKSWKLLIFGFKIFPKTKDKRILTCSFRRPSCDFSNAGLVTSQTGNEWLERSKNIYKYIYTYIYIYIYYLNRLIETRETKPKPLICKMYKTWMSSEHINDKSLIMPPRTVASTSPNKIISNVNLYLIFSKIEHDFSPMYQSICYSKIEVGLKKELFNL